jgi:hypothetical protein
MSPMLPTCYDSTDTSTSSTISESIRHVPILTKSSIRTMLNTNGVQGNTIIVQIIHVKNLSKQEGGKRFLVILSDGIHFVQALVSPSCNWIVSKLTSNDIVQITEYRILPIKQLLRIIVDDFYIKHPDQPCKLGKPVNVDSIIPLSLYDTHRINIPEHSLQETVPTFPSIQDWIVLPNGGVCGPVYNHSSVDDGSSICTSPLSMFFDFDLGNLKCNADFNSLKTNSVMDTCSGSRYRLLNRRDTTMWDLCIRHHFHNSTLENPQITLCAGGDVAKVFNGSFHHQVEDEHGTFFVVRLTTDDTHVSFDYQLDLLEYTYARRLYSALLPVTTISSMKPTQPGDDVAVLVFGRITSVEDENCTVYYDGMQITRRPNIHCQTDRMLYDSLRSLNTELKPWIMENLPTISDIGPSIKRKLFSGDNNDVSHNLAQKKRVRKRQLIRF